MNFVMAGEDIKRSDPAPTRRQAALAVLQPLRTDHPNAVEIWSDGAAKDGTRQGGAGCLIKWHDNRPNTTLSQAAGMLASSTTAVTVAALLGLRKVAQELYNTPDSPAVFLLFDSRALFHRLQIPVWEQTESAVHKATEVLHGLSNQYHITVVWIPGHSGIEENDAADAAATAARDTADQSAIPLTESSLKFAVNRTLEDKWDAS